MRSRQEILSDIQEGLERGLITKADLAGFGAPLQTTTLSSDGSTEKPEKLSAVDVMFYIAGIVLFSAIMSVIVQSWKDGSAVMHILLSAGVGLGLWFAAYYLIRSETQTAVRKGLINSLLLTGSLSVIAGGYIITNEIIGGFNEVNFIAGAIMLAAVGAAHLG